MADRVYAREAMRLRRSYGSLGQRQAVDVSAMWCEMREQETLERAVVDIAKRWAKAGGEDVHAQIAADNELRDAVEALESHEAKQK